MDYIVFNALKMCLTQARKQAIDAGIEVGILVASIMNIPQEGSTASMRDVISIEEMMTWGKCDESKCDFVRKYVRSHRGSKNSPTMAWDAEIAVGDVDYYYDSKHYAYSIVFGVLTDTTANGKIILDNLRKTFATYKI